MSRCVTVLLCFALLGCDDEGDMCESRGGSWELWATPESQKPTVYVDDQSCCVVDWPGGRWNNEWLEFKQCQGRYTCTHIATPRKVERSGVSAQLSCKEADLWHHVETLCSWDIATRKFCWLPSGAEMPDGGP